MNQNSTFDVAPYVGIQSRQPPDPQRFPAAHAGWFLKRERLSRGVALNKVAAHLKIRERYMWAIEEGVDAEFPQASGFFSCVSAYARYLEFDPDPLIEHYRDIMPAMNEARKRGAGNIIALWPAIRAHTRPVALATVALLAAVTGIGFWLDGDFFSSGTSKIATVTAPDDLKVLKKRKLAGQPGDMSMATSSITLPEKDILGQGSVSVRMMDLTQALKNNPRVALPLGRTAIESELDAAVANN